MAGKTNARWIRVLVDDSGGTARDISAGVSDVGPVGLTYNESDVTGYSDGVINFTLGHPDAIVEIKGPIDTTATTGSYTVLSGIVGIETSTKTVTVQVGDKAAPTTGDIEWEGEFICSQLQLNGDGTFAARMIPGSSTAPAFGTVA